ncbi:MAG TPA: hypothetical protein VFW96_02435 [Thermomicrobiales bacterium]|nr:hypothetical protein [Thermomicrobiales bacterium]
MGDTGHDEVASLRRELGSLFRAGRRNLPDAPTQQVLAARWGKNHSTVSRIERGALSSQETATFGGLYRLVAPGLEPMQRRRAEAILGQLHLDRPPAPPPPPSARFLPGDGTTWQEFFAQGCLLGNQAQWEEAIPLLRMAQGVAGTAAERADALVVEASGHLHLATARFEPALRASHAALAALGVDAAALAHGALPRATLSEPELRAAGWATHRLGQTYYQRGEFAVAESWLRATQQIGRELGDERLQHEALHFRMCSAFDQGTQPALREYGVWHSIRDRAALERALACFADAQRLQPRYWSTQGHDLRWQARILEALNEPREARRARQTAAALFRGHFFIAHVYLDEGRLAIAENHYTRAHERLHAALGLGWSTRHARLVADALLTLAELVALSMRSSDAKRALRYSIAALLAYPPYLESREGRRAVVFCADLIEALAHDPSRLWRGERQRLREEALAGYAPFHYLRGLHTSDPLDPEVLEGVLRAIDAHVLGSRGI